MAINYNLPPTAQAQVVCAIAAATRYSVPVNIFLAVVEKENGKPGQYVKNKNGTYDIGPLQFNTSYIKTLSKYGITYKSVEGHHGSCYPYHLAAWRIKQHINNDKGDIYQKVSNYHSKTAKFNAIYRADLIKRSEKLATYLNTYFDSINKIVVTPIEGNQHNTNKYVERTIYIIRR
ncbi:hypothetical protein A9G45_01420 [Gilliamella sp. HK2]|jgi:hypothetical protein|uniref:hypothetical protein n=1 Tax=unclassified Gilliamella TaxID=2685620 RepID=UPI00080E8FB9|nr:hypothetical protein [Gilliamella apicola]OCG28980.1 hypothetical protein A9G46_01685 [Gilliamella apicola]OCG31455.1 hypothetical protein A9G45_01420 [Gilliamella apicola]